MLLYFTAPPFVVVMVKLSKWPMKVNRPIIIVIISSRMRKRKIKYYLFDAYS